MVTESYGEVVNTELLAFMSRLQGSVLDVGCGRGAWASNLRALGADRIIGLEPGADADVAKSRYDDVITEPIEVAPLPPADVVIAADVLEHLMDPWQALVRLRAATVAGEVLYVSVPNAQFAKAILTVARGQFPYDPAGGFWDRTHLRWFTAPSLTAALEETGWRVERQGFALGGGVRKRMARLVPRISPFLGHQLHAAAVAV